MAGRARRGMLAPNKANFRRSKKKSKGLAGKELWYIAPAIGFGKTKPNLGAMGYLGDGAPGRGQSYKQTQFGEEFQVLRRARPWSGLHTSHFKLQTRPKAVRAKQSQLPEAGHRGGVRPGPARWIWSPPPTRNGAAGTVCRSHPNPHNTTAALALQV